MNLFTNEKMYTAVNENNKISNQWIEKLSSHLKNVFTKIVVNIFEQKEGYTVEWRLEPERGSQTTLVPEGIRICFFTDVIFIHTI